MLDVWGTLALTNVTLTGGYASAAVGFGGAVLGRIGSALAFSGSSFIDNTATATVDVTQFVGGGAIAALDYSTLSIVGCTFSRNKGGSAGSVLADRNSVVDIRSSTFSDSSAAVFGGAVYIARSGSLAIRDSTFLGSSTDGDGGVIFASSNSTVEVRRSVFSNSRAGYYGSVIYGYNNSDITLSDLQISSSTCRRGAVYCDLACTLQMANSTFVNSIGDYGVDVYGYNDSTIVVQNSSFNNSTGNACYTFGNIALCT
jgi:hypothetical protein